MPTDPDNETQACPEPGGGSASRPFPARSRYTGAILKDRYVIDKELGRGGFGVVYLARDQQLMSRLVVIKILTEDFTADPWHLKKFHQEIEALARIDHPGVVGALDTGETEEGKPFLVMQFVEGVNLRSLIRTGGLPLQRAASFIRQIGHALSAAHEKGIVHRDLKPENVMIQTLGDGEEYVKLIDFGIAAIKDSRFAGPHQTTKVAGSYAYMSPEQFEGTSGPESDIYAFGVMAYEMITGQHPFPIDNLFQLMLQQKEGVKTLPRQLRPDLPEAAQQAILRALSPDPAARYAKPREFGDALFRALTERPTLATMDMPTMAAVPAPEAAAALDRPPSSGSGDVETGRLEMAHVLFLDLVGYSTLPMDVQTAQLRELQEAVRATPAFQAAERHSSLMRIPTGDGMALVFFQDPVAPVECAVDLARALRSRPHIRLRSGIHSGPVYRVADINANRNVAGGGINMAQRVMDCGDAGHILVSRPVAEMLSQLSRWSGHLQDLGEHAVKHGALIHIYNLCLEDAGNPAVPSRLAKQAAPPRGRQPALRKTLLAVAAVLLLAIAGFSAYRFAGPRKQTPPPPAELSLNYSLTVQKYRGGKPDGAPFQIPGEVLVSNQDRLAVHIAPPRPGHLYILNEGPLTAAGDVSFNVLFPDSSPGSSSALSAGQTVRLPPSREEWFVFDDKAGVEKLYLVWSERPVELMERVKSLAPGPMGVVVIQDAARVREISAFLQRHLVKPGQVSRDDTSRSSTIRAPAEVLVHLVRLEHH